MTSPIPAVGLTYPTVTGETKTQAFLRLIQEFPEMGIWSDYYNGTDLPSWSSEWFKEQYSGIKYYLVSVKHTDVNAIGARMATIPAHLCGRILVFLHHEPDQWRSVSDNRGDPDPTTWKNRQIAFANLRAGAAWRDCVQHWVCFTEDRYRTDTSVWESNWGNTVDVEPRIDGVAWDCFNIGRSIVRSGSDIYGKPFEFNRREGKPFIARENGQVTPVDQPIDSIAVADAVAENWEYAKAQNGVNGLEVLGICWYNNHNNTLSDLSGERRPLTAEVIRSMMYEASQEPPDHSQDYQNGFNAGFQAGVASRAIEIADLENTITTLRQTITALEQQLIDANNAAATAKAQGRLEAFGEVVNWAQTQS